MSAQQPISVQDDEIDLAQLFNTLRQRWKWLLFGSLCGLALAGLQEALTPKHFQVSAILSTTPSPQLNPLLTSDTPTVFLHRIRALLTSAAHQNAFLAETRQQELAKTLEQLELPLPDKRRPLPESQMAVRLSHDQGTAGAELLNSFIQYTLQTQLKYHLQVRIQQQEQGNARKHQQIMRELQSEREKLNTIKQQRLEALENALFVAKKLNIQQPYDIKIQGLMFTADSTPLYLRGVQALTAEREQVLALEATQQLTPRITELKLSLERLADDPDLAQLRELQHNLELPLTVQPVTLLAPATPSAQALGPSLPARLSVGGMTGLMLAMLATLISGRAAHIKISKEKRTSPDAGPGPAAV